MKLIDELVANAATADAEMGRLASHEEAALARRAAYEKLQRAFDRAASDGKLTDDEIAELMKGFQEAGLDTATLDDIARQLGETDNTVGVDVTSSLRNKISEQIAYAKLDEGSDPLFNFKAQQAVGLYKQSFEAAANVQKAEHDIYMVAIRNLVA